MKKETIKEMLENEKLTHVLEDSEWPKFTIRFTEKPERLLVLNIDEVGGRCVFSYFVDRERCVSDEGETMGVIGSFVELHRSGWR